MVETAAPSNPSRTGAALSFLARSVTYGDCAGSGQPHDGQAATRTSGCERRASNGPAEGEAATPAVIAVLICPQPSHVKDRISGSERKAGNV